MKRVLVASLAASLMLCGAASAQTPPAQTPPASVVNGDFESVADNLPAGWTLSSANPEIFSTKLEKENNNTVLHFKAADSKMSGYWIQSVDVKPNTRYQLKARVKMNGGKVLVWANGNTPKGVTPEYKLDGRTYVESSENHPLVPLFWKLEWVAGGLRSQYGSTTGVSIVALAEPGKWVPVEVNFNSGPLTSIRINLGAYFAAGEYWFDDVTLSEVKGQ